MKPLHVAAIAFAVQVVGLVLTSTVFLGAPAWAEIPYAPFQALFVHLMPERFWAVGLVLGALAGMIAYAALCALVASRVGRGSEK